MTGELDYLKLIVEASLPVKIVMLLLLIASIASWTIIVYKSRVLNRAARQAHGFEERFWSGADLAALFRDITHGGKQPDGMEGVFEAGFREFARLRQRRGMDPQIMLEGAQRAMRVALNRELDRLEHRIPFLATVGSISPYVGLLGTVWGIMLAFDSLAGAREATIAVIAPHISEALIATAMGLFAAIPAVIGYNRFSNQVDRLQVRFDTFMEEFSAILQRQAHADD
jgi:biopolymer transport protein TolQ